MKRRSGFGRWLRERLISVVDEVIAGLIIAAIVGTVGGIGYLAAQVLPGLLANPVLFAGIAVIAIVVAVVIAVTIWRGRKIFVPKRPVTIEKERDAVLQRLFTGRAAHLETFRRLLDAEKPERHIVTIHGVGGVGKSWLLRMYRLMCIESGVAVAIVSGDEERSALDILRKSAKEFEEQDVRLGAFNERLEDYKRIQAKVQEKTAQWSALARVGAEAGKAVPVVGPAIGVLGAEGAEQLIGLLRSILSQNEIDLYLNPEVALTDLFLDDLAEVAEGRCVVLMFDTYEQMMALDVWVRKFVGRLSANVFVVVAGRVPLSLNWRDLQPMIEAIDLKEMSMTEAKECLQKRYQEYSKQPLDEATEARLVQFGRGLPLALSWVADLVARYGAEEFMVRQKEVIADLVEVMTREAGKEWRPVLEACAVVRWFNEDILRAMLERDDVASLYNELRRFPFVRPRPEGLALHDRVRDWVNEDLTARAPERWRELNERAAKWYERFLETPGENWWVLIIEYLHHKLEADERGTARILPKHFYSVSGRILPITVQFRENLLADIRGHTFVDKVSERWVDYCVGRLNEIKGNDEEAIEIYTRLLNDPLTESKLKAWVAGSLAYLLRRAGRNEEALTVCRLSIKLKKDLRDYHGIALSEMDMAEIFREKQDLAQVFLHLRRAFQAAERDGQGREVYVGRKIVKLLMENGKRRAAEAWMNRNMLTAKKNWQPYWVGMSKVEACRFYYMTGRPENVNLFEKEAEQISSAYGYWDQLAWLRVVQGSVSVDAAGLTDSDSQRTQLLGNSFAKYSEAMVYALRYSHFLLDEVLEQIIAKCKERDAEGCTILERLAEFWRTGSFEGKSLLELEREGREREKGNGKLQTGVLERLQAALQQKR